MRRGRTVIRSRIRIRKRIVVVILVGSLVSLFLGALIIPLYSYPGNDWNAIIKAKQANPGVAMVAIINPNNGPGQSQDSTYVTGVNDLRSAGVVVLGYVYTQYAARDPSSVIADVNSYKSWYNVGGIFFDEMSNVQGNENYYSSLNKYAKSIGLTFTVGNPGAGVPSSYIGTVDVIVTYENEGVPSSTSLAQLTNGLPKNNFAIIAYGVSSPDASSISNIFNYADYVYVTNRTLPNPYGALSGDFASLVASLNVQPQSSVSLAVQSETLTGTPIVGMWAVITSTNGTVVASGYTPLMHSVRPSSGYVVSIANYGNKVFDHWDDGTTNPVRTVTPTRQTTLTARYMVSTPVSLTLQSASLNGSPLTGLSAVIRSNGQVVASGLTPFIFIGALSTSYSITLSDASASYVFNHWDDGSEISSKTITLTQPTTLTAYYSGANTPDLPSGTQALTLLKEPVLCCSGTGATFIQATYRSNLNSNVTAILYGVVHNEVGQTVLFLTERIIIAAGENVTATIFASAGLPPGTYNVSIFCTATSGVGISTTASLTYVV